MLLRYTVVAVVALLSVAAAATANSQAMSTQVVQKFREWILYSHKGTPTDICFLSAQPRERKPAGYNRGRSYSYISAWPRQGVKAEVSMTMGKPFLNGSAVEVRIGGTRYDLFTKGDKAFVSDLTQELKLINSMKRGSYMFVKGTTADGTNIEDVYSLSGVTAGVNRLSQGCT